MSRKWWLGAAAVLAVAAGTTGCKKAQQQNAGGTTADTTAVPAGPAALLPARGVGMDDPFARLTGETAKALNNGYKALKAKKYDDARNSFNLVVTAVPDYTAARYQEVRAAALAGHLDDVPTLWGELLARDFMGYAGRLEKPKDMAALRASPAWAKVQAIEAAAKTAYAVGLDKGFFFVARSHDAGAPSWKGADAKLDLHQEVYFFDPASQRYRRFTDTDGQVFAINVAPDRKTLSFMTASQLTREAQEGGPSDMFVEPKGGSVDLKTIETIGPFKMITAPAAVVTLAWTPTNEPVWIAESDNGSKMFAYDAAHTALVGGDWSDSKASKSSHATVALPGRVQHTGAALAGAKLADDRMAVMVDGYDKPLRAAHALEASTLEWSPGKKLLAYAGTIDACKVLGAGKGDKVEKNELFLWDGDKKQASRVTAAVSAFDTLWLDDDHLVYEGGVGKDGKLHVYQPSTRTDIALKPHYGAGIYGFPSLSCETPAEPAEVDVNGDAPDPSMDPNGSGDSPAPAAE